MNGRGAFSIPSVERPFSSALKVGTETGCSSEKIDATETFNALFGLNVERTEPGINSNTAIRNLAVLGRKQGRSVLVFWREGYEVNERLEDAFLAPASTRSKRCFGVEKTQTPIERMYDARELSPIFQASDLGS